MASGFGWKRFWYPRGKSFNLWDGGFLADPDGTWGKSLNPGVISSGELPDKGCIVLFGEPGIGKSWELRAQFEAILTAAEANGDKAVWFDLKSYSDEGRLFDRLFGSELFGLWRKGTHNLHLVLDSLDEGLIRISTIGALLADELRNQPIERLRLRIACRPAPWPEILDRALPEIFADFHAYEMAPLRRKDVREAAAKRGIADVDNFLSQIRQLDATSLAIKPVTLNFLIGTFLRDHTFPTNPVELYEKGCKILCEEANESRRSSRLKGSLTADQRLVVAARIAAVMRFSNRDAIYLGTESSGVPPEDIRLNDLTGETERDSNGNKIVVSAEAIEETLDTGLFSSMGPNRIAFAHQTYSEFLAAFYCHRHRVPFEQARSLLFHPAGKSQKLVPQLREVAAWLSAMSRKVLDAVAKAEPEAVLSAGAAGLSNSQRETVVQSLLEQTRKGQASHLRWELLWMYGKLGHPRLSEQLLPYVGKENPPRVRIQAADIARAAKATELAPCLADIALDSTEEQGLRNTCAAAVADIGDSDTKRRLLPLATGAAGSDPEDELKGSALKALWPEHLTMSEITPLITPPKQPNLHGAYTSFLDLYFLPKARIEDIPILLDWLLRQDYRSAAWAFKRLLDAIVKLAWPRLDQPDVALGLAKTVLSRMSTYDDLCDRGDRELVEQIEGDDKGRRTLLSELLPGLDENGMARLMVLEPRLALATDVEWLIERIRSQIAPGSARLEAELVCRLAGWRKPEEICRLYDKLHSNEILWEECGSLFGPVMLDSQEVKWVRENRARRQPVLVKPAPRERVEERLRRIESGNVSEWVSLVFDLTLEPDSRQYATPGSDLTLLPGWKSADEDTRARVIAAGARYIEQADPENEKWISTNTTPYTAIAGFHALGLMHQVSNNKLKTLTPAQWAKWTPAILRSRQNEPDESRLRLRLFQRAYAAAPKKVLDWIRREIDSENTRSGNCFLEQDLLESTWDDQMGCELLEKAADPALKANALASVLGLVAKHNTKGWHQLATSFLSSRKRKSGHERAAAAIGVLIANSPDASWEPVWATMKRRSEIGRAVIESLSWGFSDGSGFFKKLTEPQLGELYIWMHKQYPGFAHLNVSGAVGPSHTAVMLRDSILEHLKRRGTFAACDAIRKIMRAFPEYQWLAYHLEQAELAARAASWQPIDPRQFLKLAFDSEKRFVETSEQLMEAVLVSLGRLQKSLHDELPTAKFLWNEDKGTFRPKDEEDLSDYVAKHLGHDLRDRGIIVNREVQIRSGTTRGSGQRTDIHVDAIIPGTAPETFERAYVIVEVKGNWNAQLSTAMKAQLRDRYLKNNHCMTGIYLVGWYSCSRWSVKDKRRRQCPSISIEQAKTKFAKQAEGLSVSGYSLEPYVLDVALSPKVRVAKNASRTRARRSRPASR